MLPHEPVLTSALSKECMTLEQQIIAFNQKHPNPVEKYDHKVSIKGDKAKKLIEESGDPKVMDLIAKIDDKKSYTFTKSAYRAVNLMRRIKQFEKEKRSDKYIIAFILKLEQSQKDYFREKLKLNGDQQLLPAPEGSGSEHQPSDKM